MIVFHVLPVADVIAHEKDDDCVCGPTVQELVRVDGRIDWVLTHHGLVRCEDTEVES